jgi:glycerol-3-phosphate dehydrogenase (NAD(P)+)
MDVTVLGAGAMGSSLTIPLVDNDHTVTLWGSRFDEEIMEALRSGERHPRIDKELPNGLEFLGPDELEEAVTGADLVVLGVSSNGVVPMTNRIAPYLRENQPLVSIAKGMVEMEEDSYLIHDGIQQILEEESSAKPPVVSVGGPSIAAELAERSRTAVTFASQHEGVLNDVVEVFATDYYSIQPTTDVKGMDVCIGYKNAYSIALAWPKGLAESRETNEGMTNFRAILFLQTLEELKTMAKAFGGREETVYGLAGLGDLVTTTAAGRNGSFGKLLGSGHGTDEALTIMEERGVGVIEGYETADAGAQLVQSSKSEQSISMDDVPLLREINNVLYEGKSVRDAVDEINF